MGTGMCSRKQKRIIQSLFLLTVVVVFLYGGMLYFELQDRLQKTQALALKYQQHQESLSAQLQVVYEHRSRLEKSLQRERLEHKKAKEDFLVYKLEAQETLNKGRQDSNNRYNALNAQHQLVKSQLDELKKQYTQLQEEHEKLEDKYSKTSNDHKLKYLQLQQDKEQDLSKLKENIYNLQEENRLLRKAHQDVHVQLQDVKVEVEEYKHLKETLNKIPSFRQPGQTVHLAEGLKPQQIPDQKVEVDHKAELQQEHEDKNNAVEEQQEVQNVHIVNKFDHNAWQKEADGHEQHNQPVVEYEQRKEMQEEEMEQAGQPEQLEEEPDQVQEELEHQQDQDEKRHIQEDSNKLAEQQKEATVTKGVERRKSPYEEQLEQQRLLSQKAEEARRLREAALHQQRLQEQFQRQKQAEENEVKMQHEVKHEEEPFHQDNFRHKSRYDNIDQDIVQGDEEQGMQEEENPEVGVNHEQDEHMGNGMELQPLPLGRNGVHQHLQKAADEDVNPADDPNNQGEDEFEEAEQEREENLADDNEEQKPQQQRQNQNPEVEEHLVMAGNPDQQEDNVDEHYQEEGEEEVQEDLTEEHKREPDNAEEQYGENNEENDDRKGHRGVDREEAVNANKPEEEVHEDENYEEDEEAQEGKQNERAEM
ncbi:Golgi integral membrane protein 4 isoform X2 [Protopterus annectens]|uniref:Golgi integral membrane protein 4 isoform X2 n=1 Tax=Protopterus annectens TaxID=7888 RepID=UPI001CFB0258|nr:Golgi integral membrane protein 4 isoform X2 [Protopterus annectens]